jgi:hypothetical protein
MHSLFRPFTVSNYCGINFVLAATAQAVGRPSQLNIAIFSPIIAIGVELLFMSIYATSA